VFGDQDDDADSNIGGGEESTSRRESKLEKLNCSENKQKDLVNCISDSIQTSRVRITKLDHLTCMWSCVDARIMHNYSSLGKALD
jgi:hypothetical protein